MHMPYASSYVGVTSPVCDLWLFLGWPNNGCDGRKGTMASVDVAALQGQLMTEAPVFQSGTRPMPPHTSQWISGGSAESAVWGKSGFQGS